MLAPNPISVLENASLIEIARFSEFEVNRIFELVRWNGCGPTCPRCEREDYYLISSRPGYRCVGCGHTYTVTSGTMLAGRKMCLRDYLCIMALFVQNSKGISSLQICRNLGVQQKSAWVALHKLREVIQFNVLSLRLSGVVEIDGATFGGYRRVENHAGNGFLKRRYIRKYDNRHVVVVARQRFGRTIPFIADTEGDAASLMIPYLMPDTVLVSDGAHAWDSLNALFDLLRIEHKFSFSANNACTNWAESFFSILRRTHFGVHHKISKQHMHAYACEIAWKQDFRELSDGTRLEMLLGMVLSSNPSIKWSGYWQKRSSVA